MSITGRWVGYYLNPTVATGEFPIIATFEDLNGQLSGTMIDERVTTSLTVQELLKENPVNSQHGEEWAVFASEYPDAIWTTTLPVNSLLKGQIQGTSVHFTKTYIGKTVMVCKASGLTANVEESDNLPIEYKGVLSSDSTSIQGNWSIYKTAFLGLVKRTLFTGEFRLERV